MSSKKGWGLVPICYFPYSILTKQWNITTVVCQLLVFVFGAQTVNSSCSLLRVCVFLKNYVLPPHISYSGFNQSILLLNLISHKVGWAGNYFPLYVSLDELMYEFPLRNHWSGSTQNWHVNCCLKIFKRCQISVFGTQTVNSSGPMHFLIFESLCAPSHRPHSLVSCLPFQTLRDLWEMFLLSPPQSTINEDKVKPGF